MRRIIIPDTMHHALVSHLLKHSDVETHAFLFGGFTSDDIFASRIWLTEPGQYEVRTSSRIDLSRTYIQEALDYARRNAFAVIDTHSHPFTAGSLTDAFSGVDDAFGHEDALWILDKHRQGLFPLVPWGMVMVSPSGSASRVFDYRTKRFRECAVVTPTSFAATRSSTSGKAVTWDQRFDRQVRLWGDQGQRRLAALKVAIVGVGGLGSIVVEQLARIGVKQFTLIDGDVVEESNLARLTGFLPSAVGRKKASVAKRYLRRISGHGTRITVVPEPLNPENGSVLAGHDVVIGCVDSEGARLLINDAALRYLIPYLDLGTAIHQHDGHVTDMGGQLRFVNPGTTPCLQCYRNGIDPSEASLDLMSASDNEVRRQLGYVVGTDASPEASVIPLNGVVASICVGELTKLVCGFARPHTYLVFDAITASIRVIDGEIPLLPRVSCPACGIGGVLGLGSNPGQVTFTKRERALLERTLGQTVTHADVVATASEAVPLWFARSEQADGR